ncbi:MAG: hypothetical protein QXO40_05095, partial [Candidatus Aenigmatarchaeota archaeon]
LELKDNGVWGESLVDFGTPCSPSYIPQMLSQPNEGLTTTSSSRFISLVKNESGIVIPNITLNESKTTEISKNESSEQVEKKNESKEDIKTALVTAPVKAKLEITNIGKIIIGVLISVLVFVLLKFLFFK